MSDRYDGPVCWVPYDHEGPDGAQLEGGWHYSTKQHPELGEIPDQKLHLNDYDVEGADHVFVSEHTGEQHTSDAGKCFYELATDDHKSWVEKHGVGNLVTLGEV